MDQYIGKLLDNRYEILERIGTGGMAVVYKARCHWLNRLVAVKILRADLAQDAEIRRRFHDESQAVAMLSHPNIVSVYDVSRTSEPDYIVMELIDGITLKQYIQKRGGKLSWKEALHFITQIMKALSHAHSRGIIHRDIKPHNMMVLRDGSLKVADFGIARVTSADQSTLTQEALGSVHYISPEQARGSHIDARSDIYSAGVVLYEMITGRLPFEGDSPVSVAIQHINSIPLSPRDIDPELPEALEAITMKAMASDMNQRYVSADAMLADLEEFRKNPSINFDYTADDLLSDTADEPTQILGANTPHMVKPMPAHGEHTEDHRASPGKEFPARGRDDYYRDDRYASDGVKTKSVSRLPIILAVCAIVVFLIGVGVFLWVSFFSGIVGVGEQHFSVPKLVGLTVDEAKNQIDVINGQFIIVEGGTLSSDAPVGQIIAQNPENGLNADKGSTITVTVSTGNTEVKTMPDLYNEDYRVAVNVLINLGIPEENIVIEERNDEEVSDGYVITQVPAARADLTDIKQATLVISKGPKVVTVKMISFLHMLPDEAQERAEQKLNLNYGGITGQEYSADVPEGHICWQNIQPDTEVEEGTTIYFRISKGPDPNADPHYPVVSPSVAPSPEPSTDPVQPTHEPVPDVVEPTFGYKNIPVQLPNDGRESVTVRIQVGNNNYAYNNVVDTALNEISVTVAGKGSEKVTVFIDEKQVDSFSVDFGA